MIVTLAQLDTTGQFFDGGDDFISISQHPAYAFGNTDFTFECVFNLSASQPNTHPVFISSRPASNEFQGLLVGLNPDGHILVQVGDALIVPVAGSGQVDYRDNKCHHLAVVRNGTEVSIFVDGEKIWADIIANDVSIASAHPFWLGRDEPDSGRTAVFGMLREVRLWNRSRSRNELMQFVDRYINRIPDELVGYWHLDEKTGQVFIDQSNNKNSARRGRFDTEEENDPGVLQICPLLKEVPELQVTFTDQLCDGDSLVVTVSGGIECEEGFNYSMELVDGSLAEPFEFNTTLIIPDAEAGHYIIKGDYGAEQAIQVFKLSEDACFPIEVFDLFTPNSDGINDFFCVRNIERFDQTQVEVMNKWGEVVFSANNYQNDWDGEGLASGYYHYIVIVNEVRFSGRLFIKK